MLLLIDNYDSFTYNLFHYLGELGAEVVVKRNDELERRRGAGDGPDAIVLSPGPCTPNEAGICLDADQAGERARADPRRLPRPSGDRRRSMAAKIVRAPEPMHGKLSRIHHTGKSVFRGLNNDFLATRYHSLTIAPREHARRASKSPPPATTASSRA